MAKLKYNTVTMSYDDNRLESLRQQGAAMSPQMGNLYNLEEQQFAGQRYKQQLYDDYAKRQYNEINKPEQQSKTNRAKENTLKGLLTTTLLNPLSGSLTLAGIASYLGLDYAVKSRNYPGGGEALIRDNFNNYMASLAGADADDATGALTRLDQVKSLLPAYYKSLDIEDQITSIQAEQQGLVELINSGQGDAYQLWQLHQQLQSKVNNLKKQYDSLKDQRSLLESITKMDATSRELQDTMQSIGTKDFGKYGSNWFSRNILDAITGNGETTPVRDVVKDATKYLFNIGNPNISSQDKRTMLDNAKDMMSGIETNLQAIQQHNKQQQQKYQTKVSDFFNQHSKTPGMDFFDADTYMYKLSGVLGSSAASWRSSLASLAISTAATASAVPTGGMSIAAAAPVVFGINRGQGYTENNAEVANAARESFIQKLGGQDGIKYKLFINDAKQRHPELSQLSNDDISDLYLSGQIGVDNSTARTAKIDATRNIDSLLRHDMMATTGDAALETILQLMPIGSLSGLTRGYGAKWLRVNSKLFARAHPTLSNAAKDVAQAVSKNTKLAQKILNPMGLGGQLSAPIVGTALAGTKSVVGRLVGDTALGDLGRSVFDKVENAGRLLGKGITPKRLRSVMEKLEANPKFQTTKRYITGYGGRLLQSHVSEGIEEGKQHQYAEDFKNGQLNDDPSFWSMLKDDLINGFDMAYDIARIPLDGLGLTTIADQDRLAEIKGGMLASNPTSITNVVSNTLPYVREMKADDVIINNMIAEKTKALDLLSKNKAYLRKGLTAPGYNDFMNAFDKIEEYNNQHHESTGNWGIAPELLADERNRMQRVISLANDADTKEEAKRQGIDPKHSNKDFQDYVALKALALNHYVEEYRKYDAIRKDENLQKIEDDYIQREKDSHEQFNVDGLSPNGQEEADAEQGIRAKIAYSEALAKLDALLNIKKYIRDSIKTAAISGRVRVGLQKYIDRIDRDLAIAHAEATAHARAVRTIDYNGVENIRLFDHQVVRTKNDIDKLIVDRSLHDQLVEHYEDVYKQYNNVLNAQEAVDQITGDKHSFDKEGRIKIEHGKGKAKRILENIDKTAKKDNNFYYELERQISDHEEAIKAQQHANEYLRANDVDEEGNPIEQDGWNDNTGLQEHRRQYAVKDGHRIIVDLNPDGTPTQPLGDGWQADPNTGEVYKDIAEDYQVSITPTFGKWDSNQQETGSSTFTNSIIAGTVSAKEHDSEISLRDALNQQTDLYKQQKEQEKQKTTPEYQQWADDVPEVPETAEERKRLREESTKGEPIISANYTPEAIAARKAKEQYEKSHLREARENARNKKRNENRAKAKEERKKQKQAKAKNKTTNNAQTEDELFAEMERRGFLKNPRRDPESGAQPTGMKLGNKQVLKNPQNGRLYVLKLDHGKFKRDYNINPDELEWINPRGDKFQIVSSGPVITPTRPPRGPEWPKEKQPKHELKYLPNLKQNPEHGIEDAGDAQQNTINKIREKIKNDETAVIKQKPGSDVTGKYDVTSQSYFVKNESGRVVRFGRLHAHLSPNYYSESANDIIESARKDLSELKNVQAVIDYIDGQMQIIASDPGVSEHVKHTMAHDLEVYKTYLRDNETVFDANMTTREVQETLNDIANVFALEDFGPTVDVGTMTDNLVRYFFSDESIYELAKKNPRQFAVEVGDMAPEQMPNRPYRTFFANPNGLENFVKQLVAIKEQYDRLGWKIISEPVTWRGEFKDVGKIAGETDLLAVDKHGDVTIIDIKTSFNFGVTPYTYTDQAKMATKAAVEKYGITVDDVKKHNKKVRDAERKLSQDFAFGETEKRKLRIKLGIDRESIYDNQSGKTRTIEHVVAYDAYSPFYDVRPGITFRGSKNIRSQFDFYTDQQNAYRLMATSELALNIRGVEILPVVRKMTEHNSAQTGTAPGIISLSNFDLYELHYFGKVKGFQTKEDAEAYALELGISNPDIRKGQPKRLILFLRNPSWKPFKEMVTSSEDFNKTVKENIDAVNALLDGIHAAITSINDMLAQLPYDKRIPIVAKYIEDAQSIANQATDLIRKDEFDPYTNVDDFDNLKRIRQDMEAISNDKFEAVKDVVKAAYDEQIEMQHQHDNEEASYQDWYYRQLSEEDEGILGWTDDDYKAAIDARNYFDGLDADKMPPKGPKGPSKPIQPIDKSGGVYAKSKTHNGAFDNTNLFYKTIDADPELSAITLAPDFITAGKFEVFKGDNGKLYCQIHYHGKVYKRILIATGFRPEQQAKLNELIKRFDAIDKPGVHIFVKPEAMRRTYGRIIKNPGNKQDQHPITHTDLIGSDENALYEIEMSPKYKRAGYVDKGRLVTWGSSDKEQIPLGVKMLQGENAPKDGTFMWLKPVKRDEKGGDIEYIPVSVDKKHFDKSDIDFIVKCIKNPDFRLGNYIINDTDTHIPVSKLLNLLFPIAYSDSDVLSNPGGDKLILQFLGTNNTSQNSQASTKVALRNRTDVASQQLNQDNVFDLSTDEGTQRFIQRLSQLTIPEQHTVMGARLGNNDDQILPFKEIRDYLLSGQNKQLDITGTLKFDRSDFAIVNVNGERHYGLSGLGWYVKRGVFVTDYQKIGAAIVGINGPMNYDQFGHSIGVDQPFMIEDFNKPDETDKPIDPTDIPLVPTDNSVGQIDETPDFSMFEGLDDYYDDPGADKKVDLDEIKKHKPINEKRARRRIAAICGDIPVTVTDDVIELMSQENAAIVGKCYDDAIKIWREAPDRVDFHEAFHRCLELLMPEKDRTKVYDAIARRLGITGDYYEDATIGEAAADDFMDYAKGYMEVNIPIVKQVYNAVRDFTLWLFHKNKRDLYRIYGRAMRGKYRNYIPLSKKIQRFKREFPAGANYTIHGVGFEHIMDGPMYDKIKQSAMYTIMAGINLDPSGKNIQEIGKHINKESFLRGAERIYGRKNMSFDMLGMHTDTPNAGQMAMKELYDNFNNPELRDDIANAISAISTDYTKNVEREDVENLFGTQEEAQSSHFGEYTRASYEFRPFDSTTSSVRYFLSTIPEVDYDMVKDKDGKWRPVAVLKLNEFGLPHFAPASYVYNDMLSVCHDITYDAQLIATMQRLGKTNPMFGIIGQKLFQVYKKAKDPNNKNSVDNEAFWTQLRNALRKHKYRFEIGKAIQIEGADPSISPFGVYTTHVQSTDMDSNASFYPAEWSRVLANGGSPLITMDETGVRRIKPKFALQFKAIHDMFDSIEQFNGKDGVIYKVGLKQILENAQAQNKKPYYIELKVLDKVATAESGRTRYTTVRYTDPTKDDCINAIKDSIVRAFATLGINMNRDEFEYMLMSKYGNSDWRSLSKMINSKNIDDSMTTFINFLGTIVADGKINQTVDGKIKVGGKLVDLDKAYTKMAFVKNLANWKYEYRHMHDQLTVLATNNNKYYLISENNMLTDMQLDLNERRAEYQRLVSGQDPYTYREGDEWTDDEGNTFKGDYIGSYVLNELKKDDEAYAADQNAEAAGKGSVGLKRRKLQFVNVAGFKTDERGDYGEDYFQMQQIEDVLVKIMFLQNGDIISPTRADKKDYSVLRGIRLPGFDYRESIDSEGHVKANKSSDTVNKILIPEGTKLAPIYFQDSYTARTMLNQDTNVLDVFLAYAKAEYESVKKANDELDKMEADVEAEMDNLGLKGDARKAYRKKFMSSQVENYYTKENGARFGQMIGIWVPRMIKDKDSGQWVVDINNPDGPEEYISFNDKNKDRRECLQDAEDWFFNPVAQLENPADLKSWQYMILTATLAHRLDDQLKFLTDIGLIEKVGTDKCNYYNYKNKGLDAIAIESIYQAIPKEVNGVRLDADKTGTDRLRSLAVVMYVNDISNKAIMSGVEYEKLFGGNPAFYKWKYNSSGQLVDRTVDELKRFGGHGSTGQNNYLELSNIPEHFKRNGVFTGVYRCAEVENEMVQSSQYEMLVNTMYSSMLLDSVRNAMIDKAVNDCEEYVRGIAKQQDKPSLEEQEQELDRLQAEATAKADAMSIEDAENYIKTTYNEGGKIGEPPTRPLAWDETPYDDDFEEKNKAFAEKWKAEQIKKESPHLNAIKAKAQAAADSYKLFIGKDGSKDGIDVADGAAYVTDDMCEMLLRMIGAYSSDIKKAFEIMRDESNTNILQKASVYKQIITTVIGTQKYTAFGRRVDPRTQLLVTYFHKYALFPIFKCMATGKMRNIYDKMKQQGVDMLLIHSAVKVGSQGAQDINWDDWSQSENDGKPQFNADPNDGGFSFNTYDCEFKYLRKQLNTDPDDEKYMNIGTQMTKIAFSNLVPDRNYIMRDGSKVTGQQILDSIMSAMNRLSDIGRDEIDKEFFKVEKNDKGISVVTDQPDPKKFAKQLKKMLKDDDPNRNLIESLEVVQDGTDENGKTRYRLSLAPDAIQSSAWLESKLISEVNSKVIDVESPGAPFIQRSVWGMEGTSLFSKDYAYDAKKGQIIGDDNIQLYNGKPLQMVNSEGSMDCVLSIDYFYKILGDVEVSDYTYTDKEGKKHPKRIFDLDSEGNKQPLYEKDKDGKYKLDENGKRIQLKDKTGNPIYKTKIQTLHFKDLSFEDARRWLINQGIIGENAKANIVAYRIPTQAQSSIHALRCVDVIAAVNDTVILPKEFTKITGSDFDIDKLFLSALNYEHTVSDEYKDNGKRTHGVTTQVSNEKQRLQNEILEGYLALLIDKDEKSELPRSMSILHRSIDNDTALGKDVLNYIESGATKDQEQPFDFYTLSKQTSAKNDYITGKIGIGPFALNNNNQILTMLYHVKFASRWQYNKKLGKVETTSLMDELGLTHLDKSTSQDGTSILSWLSCMINAHVDIAKDPWISRLNVNPFTYNIVNLLIRTGFGANSLYFVNQPIMHKFAQAYNRASATYMQQGGSGSKTYRQKQAIKDEAEAIFGKDFRLSNGIKLSDAVATLSGEEPILTRGDRISINEHIHRLFDPNDIGFSVFDNDVNKRVSAAQYTAKTKDFDNDTQAYMYLAYLQFDRYAMALSNLVKFCKIDTKKQGKSLSEQFLYDRGYNDLFRDGETGILFDSQSLKRLRDKSYVGVKTRNALDATREVMAPYFISATPGFYGALTNLLQDTGHYSAMTSPDIIRKHASALMAFIKAQYFNDTAHVIGETEHNPNYLYDLVNTSYEKVSFDYDTKTGLLTVKGLHHKLISYRNNPQTIWFTGTDGVMRSVRIKIVDCPSDDTAHIVVLNQNNDNVAMSNGKPILPTYNITNGFSYLTGGLNTIYDRLNALQIRINSDAGLTSLQSNHLLQMLHPGATFKYKKPKDAFNNEVADMYNDAKFVKLENFIDDGGINANYIIDAWDALFNYTNEDKALQNEVRKFARDLVYYAFITSGDSGGWTKMFKYVPASWRSAKHQTMAGPQHLTGTMKSYSDFMFEKLNQFQAVGYAGNINYDDIILNNWWDNSFVPVYRQDSKDANGNKVSNFICAYTNDNTDRNVPTMLIAARKDATGTYLTIDPGFAPKFIKIPRHEKAYNTQNKYSVYKLIDAGSINGNQFPVYMLVEPKGMQFTGGYLITEYGRNATPVAGSDIVIGPVRSRSLERTSYGDPAIDANGNYVYQEGISYDKGTPIKRRLETHDADYWAYGISTDRFGNVKQDPDFKGYKIADFIQQLPTYQRKFGKGITNVLATLNAKWNNVEISSSSDNNETNERKTFVSGGADGSDTYWSDALLQYGVKVQHITPTDYDALSEEDRGKVEKEYQSVVKILGRREMPASEYRGKLVRRDMLQADNAPAIFAVGRLEKNGYIDGGTAYATTRAIQLGIPVHLFNQDTSHWMVWSKQLHKFVNEEQPELIEGASLVGSRSLSENGKRAIDKIVDNYFKNHSDTRTKEEIDELDDSMFDDDYMNFCRGIN